MQKHIISSAALLTLIVGTDARAIGSLADVSIVDRDTGAPLPVHLHRGEYWVAGSPGARYAIEIRNRLGERVLAVTSVDGVNVVSGATAAWDQTGYVFGANQDYQITGWRKSDAEIAAFAFTNPGNSYASRTGRPANVGTIGVAVFRERPASPPPQVLQNLVEESGRRLSSAADAAASAPRAPSLAPQLGTAHGERESSYVAHTEFERAQSVPNEIIRIRYDSLENLIAMGIVIRPRPAWRAPDAFPGSDTYVPDPPG